MKVLSGVILEHDKFGNHLDANGMRVDKDLELKNFEYAGRTLAKIWSGLVIDGKPAPQNTDIPVRILKQNSDIFGNYVCDFFNECVDKGVFLSILKNYNITPVFKKGFRG